MIEDLPFFAILKLKSVVAFTPTINIASLSVMKKLGMLNTNQKFMHPAIKDGSETKERMLTKIAQKDWKSDV